MDFLLPLEILEEKLGMCKPKQPPLVRRMKERLRANPKVNLINMNLPLGNGDEIPRLKDVLETEVDDKYYLRHEIVEKICRESNFQERLVSIKVNKEDK